MKSVIKAPVLIVGFNRPGLVRTLFEQVLSLYAPEKIYFAVDGPREDRSDEKARVAEVRAVADQFRSDARIECLFQDRNLGCAWGVPTGLTWMMEQEECGIVLEDDIEVTAGFFEYMNWSLSHYRTDATMMHVSAFQSVPCELLQEQPELMINTLPHCWGWGTWRRAWQHYDPEIIQSPSREISAWLRNAVKDWRAVMYMRLAIQMTQQQKVSAWDYRWMLCIARAKGLCLTPRTSLVRNVGFGADSTHTQRAPHANEAEVGQVNWGAVPLLDPIDPVLGERVHVLTHRANSWARLARMQLGVWMPNPVFFSLMKLFRR